MVQSNLDRANEVGVENVIATLRQNGCGRVAAAVEASTRLEE